MLFVYAGNTYALKKHLPSDVNLHIQQNSFQSFTWEKHSQFYNFRYYGDFAQILVCSQFLLYKIFCLTYLSLLGLRHIMFISTEVLFCNVMDVILW